MAGVIALLVSLAFATAGLTGYLIFGPLTFRHLQDRELHREFGTAGAFSWGFLRWVLLRGFRTSSDASLRGLANPACVLGWAMVLGLAGSLLTLRYLP
jgi:hypothetical protein